MTLKTYHGSCHCGAVRFEVDLDLAQGGAKCNCSFCSKARQWGAAVKPDAFRLIAGASELTDYQFATKSIHHTFCRHCGIHAFGRGHVAEIGGDFVAVSLACLDDADVSELAEAPVVYADGRNNNWMNPPAETRHL